MQRYLENWILSLLKIIENQPDTTELIKTLKNLNIILDQVGIYSDYPVSHLDILFTLLNHKNLTVIEYSIRNLAYLSQERLIEKRESILKHEDWIIRSLMYQIVLFFKPAMRQKTLNDIFEKEDHRIRWHIMEFSISNGIKEIDNTFLTIINQTDVVNKLIATFRYALINSSIQLPKILEIFSEIPNPNQKTVDIIENIAFSLWKIETKQSLDTLFALYKIYEKTPFTKHYIFFTDTYLRFCKMFPEDCISYFLTFQEKQQTELVKDLLEKEIFDLDSIQLLLDNPKLGKNVRTYAETQILILKRIKAEKIWRSEKIDDFII
jgi:hypothetical protein